jgi:hypothetical protein
MVQLLVLSWNPQQAGGLRCEYSSTQVPELVRYVTSGFGLWRNLREPVNDYQ